MILSEMTTMRKLMLLHGIVSGKSVEDFASGNPCVFTTDLAKPLRKLALSLLPRQSGTGDPSPSNIRPLLPWGELGTWTGGANLCYDSSITFNRAEKVNGEYRSTDVDTRVQFLFAVQLYDANKTYIKTIGDSYADIGIKSRTFTVDDANVKYVCIKHVGAVKSLIELYIPFNYPLGEYTVSADVVGNDPTVVGGIRMKEIQLSAGDAVYPYAEPTITPHPVNVGKNLFDKSTGIALAENSIRVARYQGQGVPLLLKKDVTYTFSCNSQTPPTEIRLQVPYTGETITSKYGNTLTYTPSDDIQVGILFYWGNGRPEDATDLMVEIGSTATEYQPYIPPVYGCEIDLVTGEVWGTHIMIQQKWGDIQKSGEPSPETGLQSAVMTFSENVKQCVHQSDYGKSTLCNVCGKIVWGNNTVLPMHYYINTKNTVWLAFNGDMDSDTIVQIVDELETPILLATLDPQQIESLIGTNTIWTDGDNVDVTYLKKG